MAARATPPRGSDGSSGSASASGSSGSSSTARRGDDGSGVPARFAIATLLTSDAYLPGALALAASLRRSLADAPAARAEIHTLVLATPATLSPRSLRALAAAYDRVVGVEPLSIASAVVDEADRRVKQAGTGAVSPSDEAEKAKVGRQIRREAAKNLALLGRPDLGEGSGAALTKLHAWRLTGYERVLFLDADTIALRSLHHLFAQPQSPLFAAPDIGWPDCFNSGVLLLTPSEATFTALQVLAATRGTWDGADQGLLNEYFGGERGRGEEGEGGGWDRLSFGYNATPNGGYTYAPAYARYGRSIHVAHFIGAHKPWSQPRPSTPVPDAAAPNNYTALLHAWHGFYEEAVPSAALSAGPVVRVIHTARGVEVVEEPFRVPTYQAAWDAGADAQDVPTGPGSVDDLKGMFRGAGQADAGTIAAAGRSGQYFSLPLMGRASLLAPNPGAWEVPGDSSDDATPRPSPPATASPRRDSPEASGTSSPQQQQQQQLQQPDRTGSPQPWEAPYLSWNPAVEPPPQGVSSYQMRAPPDAYYENAWDRPASSGPQGKAAFFKPESGNVAAEKSRRRAMEKLQREHWFDNLASTRPDPSAVKAVFPWEQRGAAARPGSRIWPDEEPPSVSPGTGAHEKSLEAASTSSPTFAQRSFPVPVEAPRRGLPKDLSYTNAWDEIGSLGRSSGAAYRRTREAQNSRGVQATPSLSAQATQAGGAYRNWGGGAGAGAGVASAASSAQEWNPNAQAPEPVSADQSGDGDDESSSGEDSSSDEAANGVPRASSPPQRDGTRSSGGSGARSHRSSTGPGRGYQRKAESSALAQQNASPRSPRAHTISLSSGSAPIGTLSAAAGAAGVVDMGRSRSSSAEDSASTAGPTSDVLSSHGGRTAPTGRARIRPDPLGASYDQSTPLAPEGMREYGFGNTSGYGSARSRGGSNSGAISPPAYPFTSRRLHRSGHGSREGSEGSALSNPNSGAASPTWPEGGASPVLSRADFAQLQRAHWNASVGRRRGGGY